jgi:hypothetical protein
MKEHSMRFVFSIAVIAGFVARGAPLEAQQATVGVPFGQAGSSFFEQSGVGFGFRGPGFFFQQNSFGQALPQFGGFDPAAGANFGFAVGNGQNQGFFNFAFGQGSRSSLVSQSPSVTIGNGGFGGFSAGSWTPFVVGAVPVVGDAPGMSVPFGPAVSGSVLEERLSRIDAEPRTASAQSPASAVEVAPRPPVAADASGGGVTALSVAQIHEARAAHRNAEQQARHAEIESLIARGESALAAGKPRVARIYFQQAARRAEGSQQARLNERAQALGERATAGGR